MDTIFHEVQVKAEGADSSIMDEEWSPEFLDSIFENNTDLLSVFDDPHKISEITSDLMEYEENNSPLSSHHSSDATDLDAFLMHPSSSSTISSSASDSGLSSDNLDFETSPDYEPLSPTLSSPGPSISERGGQNSPPRFQKVAKVAPTVHKKFNTRSSTAAANNGLMTPVSPKLVQAVHPTPVTNVKAVTGVKRGHASVSGGANNNNHKSPKEVKVYRMQPTTTTTSNNKKYSITPQTTSTKTTGAALSNGVRKILINTMDAKDLRTIKIINANTLKNPHLKIAAANLLQQSKQGLLPKNAMFPKEQYERQSIKQEIIFDEEESDSQEHHSSSQQLMEDVFIKTEGRDDDEEEDADDSDDEDEFGDRYKARGSQDKLILTTEEKRLLSKEGITLPSNYPLTKHEERELKRIRRKIRNKISAQDSRKRKKEYVDGLEERVKQCTDENQSLMKRIKMLQGQNHSLMTQMKKLQSLLSKNGNNSNGSNGSSSSTAQPTTCLMVLLLSMALIAAPNLKLGKRDASAKESELAEAIQEMQQNMQQNRRNLLFNDNVNTAEDVLEDMEAAVCNENDFIAENENFIENFYSRIGVGKGKKAPPAKMMKGGHGMFMDLDLDETVWRASGSADQVKGQGMKNGIPVAGSNFGIVDTSAKAVAFGGVQGGSDRNMMMMDKMTDNYLIMELRNNLLGGNEEGQEEGEQGKKINNSMHVVHGQKNILFQD